MRHTFNLTKYFADDLPARGAQCSLLFPPFIHAALFHEEDLE